LRSTFFFFFSSHRRPRNVAFERRRQWLVAASVRVAVVEITARLAGERLDKTIHDRHRNNGAIFHRQVHSLIDDKHRHSMVCDIKQGSAYLTAERRVPELIPVLGSQPAGEMSHKPGSTLSLLSARPAVTLATLKRAATNFAAW